MEQGRTLMFHLSAVGKFYLGYFLSTVANSLMVNGLAFVLCLGYLLKMGWYMNAADVLWVLFDMILLVLFGSTLSSIVSFPLTTQGQLSAVGTIVSAGYGFICGAYMPISNFGAGLQKVLSYLPSTYATSLIKNHMLHGVFVEMERKHYPGEMVDAIKGTLDCNPVFHEKCGKCKSDDWYYAGKYSCILELFIILLQCIGQVI